MHDPSETQLAMLLCCCYRCVAYLLTGTGQCISECNTRYTLLIQGDETGRVCQGIWD